MNECQHCGGLTFKKDKIMSGGNPELFLIPEEEMKNFFSKSIGNSLWADMCLNCGTLNRIYVSTEDLEKYKKKLRK
ncbi:MAG TPA: hypothetical protein GX003_04975 [Acholeplasmataceae bacterium]|jgi:hypothetical protein|nr:hypothetical protein [Acholeplasmataceae bacterium]